MLFKVQKHVHRHERADISKDKTLCKQLRDLLSIDKKVLVLAERLKKEEAPKQLHKPTTENIPFFNREQIFVVKKVIETTDDQFMHWVSKKMKMK